MLFWMACEELKREANKSTIEEKARIIYEDYISILSPKEVCVSLEPSLNCRLCLVFLHSPGLCPLNCRVGGSSCRVGGSCVHSVRAPARLDVGV